MEKRFQVFLSSTFQDLQEERQVVMQVLLELDCIPSGMELFSAADKTQWDLIKKLIGDCDYFILILAGRYGSPSPEGISYTEMEYKHALAIQKPIISFLHKDPGNIVSNKTESDPGGKAKLAAFRELVEQKHCKYWSSPQELGSVVSRGLINLLKSTPAVGWVRATALDPHQTNNAEAAKMHPCAKAALCTDNPISSTSKPEEHEWWPRFGPTASTKEMPEILGAHFKEGGWRPIKSELLTIHKRTLQGATLDLSGTVAETRENGDLYPFDFDGSALGNLLFLRYTPRSRDPSLGAGVYLLKRTEDGTYFGISIQMMSDAAGFSRIDWATHWMYDRTNNDPKLDSNYNSDDYIEQYYFSTTTAPENEFILKHLRPTLDDSKAGAVLDIGGGPCTLYWYSRGTTKEGLTIDIGDADVKSLERARQDSGAPQGWLAEALPPVEQEILRIAARSIRNYIPFDFGFSWPILSNSYRLVTSIFAVECLSDHADIAFAFREAFRVLERGGYAFVATISSKYGRWKVGQTSLRCVKLDTDSVRKLMQSAGFVHIQINVSPSVPAETGYEYIIVARGCRP